MKKTKIVCTLGPATPSLDEIKALMAKGMNVARLNMSHGDIPSHQKMLDMVKQARKELNTPCAIMVDTCGPELRIGTFEGGKVELEKGQKFVLSTKNRVGDKTGVFFGFPKLLDILKPKQIIYANNGLIELVVSKIEKDAIVCRVSVGGLISDHKSISIPHVRLPLPFIGKKDQENIKFAVQNKVEYISASFVSTAQDVLQMRKYISSLGGNQKIISKIENIDGLTNLDKICEVSDGIMVARGDMGTEVAIEEIPAIQKNMIKKAISCGKLVIVATEMLESMTHKRRPTRAETTDVAQAIYDKTGATMLSGETAFGEYPIVSCETMSKIALATEKNIDYDRELLSFYASPNDNLNALSYSACAAARAIGAKAIVCFTDQGKTAMMIARFRPQAPIVALTHDDFTYNLLSLVWGVKPLKLDEQKTLDKMLQTAKKVVVDLKLAKPKDKVILTLGVPTDKRGITNAVHILEID